MICMQVEQESDQGHSILHTVARLLVAVTAVLLLVADRVLLKDVEGNVFILLIGKKQEYSFYYCIL